MLGGDKSIPNSIGTFTGTNAHILIILGISWPLSLDIALFTMLSALIKSYLSFLLNSNGFPVFSWVLLHLATSFLLLLRVSEEIKKFLGSTTD